MIPSKLARNAERAVRPATAAGGEEDRQAEERPTRGDRRMSLTTELRERAVTAGIDLVGVTSANPFEVEWLDGPLVMDARDYLEDARSVVVFGYYLLDKPLADPPTAGPPRGRIVPGIASFFAMDEYCSQTIAGFLEGKGHRTYRRELSARIPLKALAVKAGIGVYGKNAIVHVEGYGSWVELGCVVTDAPLDVEEHSHRRSDCGDCTACVEACPTQAIEHPYKVVPELCIAGLLDVGAPPPSRALRAKLGDRLAGCEACQTVCPKNDGMEPRTRYPIDVPPVADSPELIPLLSADEEYCRRVLPGLVASLIDPPTLRQNAALALGNIGDPAAVPGLVRALGVPEPGGRAMAAWALGAIGGQKAREALARSLKSETDLGVREEIEAALRDAPE